MYLARTDVRLKPIFVHTSFAIASSRTFPVKLEKTHWLFWTRLIFALFAFNDNGQFCVQYANEVRSFDHLWSITKPKNSNDVKHSLIEYNVLKLH